MLSRVVEMITEHVDKTIEHLELQFHCFLLKLFHTANQSWVYQTRGLQLRCITILWDPFLFRNVECTALELTNLPTVSHHSWDYRRMPLWLVQ